MFFIFVVLSLFPLTALLSSYSSSSARGHMGTGALREDRGPASSLWADTQIPQQLLLPHAGHVGDTGSVEERRGARSRHRRQSFCNNGKRKHSMATPKAGLSHCGTWFGRGVEPFIWLHSNLLSCAFPCWMSANQRKRNSFCFSTFSILFAILYFLIILYYIFCIIHGEMNCLWGL